MVIIFPIKRIGKKNLKELKGKNFIVAGNHMSNLDAILLDIKFFKKFRYLAKKELFQKIVTSVIIQGLLLIIPVYWSRSVNHATELNFDSSLKLIVVTLVLSLLYYLWSYLNQRTWYNYYNK